jgi:hypothetical protein
MPFPKGKERTNDWLESEPGRQQALPGWLLIVVATAGCGPGTTASFDQGGPGVDTEGLKGKGGGTAAEVKGAAALVTG